MNGCNELNPGLDLAKFKPLGEALEILKRGMNYIFKYIIGVTDNHS